jgi:hypothetical protein
MTKRNITKLFAVAVLAAGTPALASPDKPVSQQQAKPITPRTLPSGRPACGNTMSKSYDPRDCDRDAITPRPVTTAAQPITLAPAARRILELLGLTEVTKTTPVARPREYRNGSPANGNVARRTAYRPEPRETPREPNEN